MTNQASEDVDSIDNLENKVTGHKLPIGWLLLYIGLIIFGIYYAITFTPEISGWSQAKEYMESIKK
jgi:hypothetical protein